MHRVYMYFFVRGGDPPGSDREVWVLNFLEPDLQTPIGKIRSCSSVDQVRGMARRGGGLRTTEAVDGFEAAIKHGRGDVWLELTAEQYSALKT